MFKDCESLSIANLNFNTSKVKQMDYMFYYCKELEYLNISNFHLENLINSQNMLKGCIKLKEIEFNNNTRTDNLEVMIGMFKNCESLLKINTKIFRINKLTKLNEIFSGCKSLEEIDLSNFETGNITKMEGIFSNCRNIENIDVSYFDTTKVIIMDKMFYNCKKLKKLNLSNFNLENLTNSENMFGNCYNLKEIIFNNNTRTNNLKRMDLMFQYCRSLEYINTNIFKIDGISSFNYIFAVIL